MTLNQILNIIGTLAMGANAIPGVPGWVSTALGIVAFAAGKLAATPMSHTPKDKYGDAGSP